MTTNGENMTILPTSWIKTTLVDVVNIRNGYAFKSSDYQTKGVLLLRQGNLGEGTVSLNKAVYLSKEYLAKYRDFEVRKGDVLIGMSGSIGKLCVYDLDAPALQNQRTGLLEILEPDMRQFVRYYFSTLERLFSAKSKGVGVQNISAKDIKACPCPIPPLAEQKRIVAKIEELFTKLDAGVEALQKVKAELKRYRQAVLKHAFEGKLTAEWREKNKDKLESASKLLERITKEREKNVAKTKVRKKKLPLLDTSNLPELPQEWVWTGFINLVAHSQNGLSKRRSDAGRPVHILRLSDIHSLEVDGSNPRDIRLAEEEAVRYKLVVGDLLCIRVNGSPNLTGQMILFKQKDLWGFCDHFIRFRLAESNVSPLFFAYQFRTETARKHVSSNMVSSAGQNTVSQTTVLGTPVAITCSEEQDEVVAEIDRQFSIADEVEQAVEKGLKQAERLRQSILKRAFAGKLVPQNPADEPAERLLERIKVEKEKLQAEQKNKKKVMSKKRTKCRGK